MSEEIFFALYDKHGIHTPFCPVCGMALTDYDETKDEAIYIHGWTMCAVLLADES